MPAYAATEELLREEDIEIELTDAAITQLGTDTPPPDVYEQSDIKREYELELTPYTALDSVSVPVDGVEKTIDRGEGVDEVTRDGERRAIRFADDIQLHVGDTATVAYVSAPELKRYVDAYMDDIQSAIYDIVRIRGSHFVNVADGVALDFIGSMFGELGERRGRSDSDYRTFLRSIVRTFNGTGTRFDMRLVISGATRGDIEEIQITEDFERTGFTVQIREGADTQISPAINEVVEMARPSGVELLDDPIIVSDGATVNVSVPGAEVVQTASGLGSDQIENTEIGALGAETEPEPQPPSE